jgi:hypothetical protein
MDPNALQDYVKMRLEELPKLLVDRETEEEQKPNIRKALEMYKNGELPGPNTVYFQDGKPIPHDKIHGNSPFWREVSITRTVDLSFFAKRSSTREWHASLCRVSTDILQRLRIAEDYISHLRSPSLTSRCCQPDRVRQLEWGRQLQGKRSLQQGRQPQGRRSLQQGRQLQGTRNLERDRPPNKEYQPWRSRQPSMLIE